MKRGRLPLTALRSFEAAGRHQSFTLAAEELFVSQAAVSRQIRELETLLGHDLFERRHRQAVLTARGRALLGTLTASFDEMSQALEEIRAARPDKPLLISADPSFSACWLMPRFHRFRQEFPDIEVTIDSDMKLTDFRAGRVEIAVRWSLAATSWPRVQAERLADGLISPVLSPVLLAGGPPLLKPADLLAYPLLHEDSRDWWRQWFAAAGAEMPPGERGPLFSSMPLAFDAAIRGNGVALADNILADAALRAGELVRPFENTIWGGSYWLVAPDFARLSPAALAFARWLREELAGMGAEGG